MLTNLVVLRGKTVVMILSFRSRDLKRLHVKGDGRGLNPQHLTKIEIILDMLENARSPEDMNLAKLDFHKLRGENPPRWSVHVNGNWCITFTFDSEDAAAVDYEDYH